MIPGSGWREEFLKNFLIASLFMAATIAPWTYRNWRVLHAWVPISTNGGDVFYRANNPLATATGQLAENACYPPTMRLRPIVWAINGARNGSWISCATIPGCFFA